MDQQRILLAHGNGGKLQQDLLEKVVFPLWQDVVMPSTRDSQILSWEPNSLAISTDSYVVNPLFFPGGNIGHLAICGTTNDLAMSGAQPLYLTVSFILEEGFALEDFKKIVASMGDQARTLGVRIAAGDLKVVDKGKGDGIYINTAGLGRTMKEPVPGPDRLRPGAKVLVSGDLARHGLVIMMSREGMEFSSDLVSDCAPLWPSVRALQEMNVDILCLRDLTRGGLATALHELA
ncbi:MAG: hydrogenase expression/formation protein HypE, partial [Bdellovibrionales bacterium]|nr:hydrogenase expression/formation protein HypE [Bdellovibrionales bacterium]